LNVYRDGAWISGADGEFRFENLPDAGYAVEALLPGQNIVFDTKPIPEGIGENGEREAMPPSSEPQLTGGEEDWFRPTRSLDYDSLLEDNSD
jgi:hypothetical protein